MKWRKTELIAWLARDSGVIKVSQNCTSGAFFLQLALGGQPSGKFQGAVKYRDVARYNMRNSANGGVGGEAAYAPIMPRSRATSTFKASCNYRRYFHLMWILCKSLRVNVVKLATPKAPSKFPRIWYIYNPRGKINSGSHSSYFYYKYRGLRLKLRV